MRMNSLFVTAFIGLCLGIVFAKRNFIQSDSFSEKVLQVLRDQRLAVNIERNQTVNGVDDEVTTWYEDFPKSHELYQEMINEMMYEFAKESDIENMVIAGSKFYDDNNCWCKGFTCGCCYQLSIPKIGLKESLCLTVAYLPDELGVQITLTLNGKVIINQKVSERNPPAICAAIPFVKKYASLCLRLYNLDFSNRHFSGCAALEAKLFKIVVQKVDLGCFKIPPNTMP